MLQQPYDVLDWCEGYALDYSCTCTCKSGEQGWMLGNDSRPRNEITQVDLLVLLADFLLCLLVTTEIGLVVRRMVVGVVHVSEERYPS